MKYGYAVTCHKAQGGEWDNVFTIWDKGNSENLILFEFKNNFVFWHLVQLFCVYILSLDDCP